MVSSSSVAQHLEHLEVVLSRLGIEELKAKLEKCAGSGPVAYSN